MNAWITNMIASSVAWIARRPALSTTLLLVLQVAVLIAFARILVAIACRNDPAAKHRVWFLTATVVLALMPIHVLRLGWQLQVPVTEAAVGERTSNSQRPSFREAETITGNQVAEFDPTTLSLLPDQNDEREQASLSHDISPAFANSTPTPTASPAKSIDRIVRSDGNPASGATVRFREQRQHLQRIEDTLQNRPKLYVTNELGQVSIDLNRMLFDQTLIEATLVDGTQGYFGLTTYVNTKGGKAKIQLRPGKLIQGHVLMHGQPVADAQVGIHMRTTTYSQQGNTSVQGFATDEYDVTRTNDDGTYRIVVPNDKEYEVNVQFAGGWAHKLLTAVRPLRTNPAGLLTGDFKLTLGGYEIAGVVVDENDKPLAHMQVAIEPSPDVSPADLIAHNLSQFTTDSNGRFSLRNVPEGTYSISVRRPPLLNPSKPGQLIEQEPTRVTAKSGDRNLRVKLLR